MNEIFHRTSIRKYTDQPVSDEMIEKILRAAMAAPSACNQQPWEFYAVTGEETKKALSKTSPYAGCAAKAGVVFVVCMRKDCMLPDYAMVDCSAAIENMLLQIDSMGLGAVWMGIAPMRERMDAAGKVLNLPDNLEVFSFVSCGYPAEEKVQEDRYEEARVHFVR